MQYTKDIEKKYKITRQTLNNWMNNNWISRPLKDEKSRLVWNSFSEKEIQQVLLMKEQSKRYYSIDDPKKLFIHNRRYLGSKQKILNFIDEVVHENTKSVKTVADVFSGTGVVADLFRRQGKKVIVNDILYSNYVTSHTWFGNQNVDYEKIKSLLIELNMLKGVKGYVTKNFANRYFTLENAMRIDAIREKIELINNINGREYFFLLTSLLYAIDKIANTVGHYDAYRKKMENIKPLELRIPNLNINSNNEIYNLDANKLVRQISADLVYIDTPYNSRGYESAYHVLENIAEWKKPQVEGVAMKAKNRSKKSSAYTKSTAPQAFDDLIQHIDSRYILVSYNNMAKKGNCRSNAKISNDEIITTLEKRGKVNVYEIGFVPYTTGKSNIQDHKELLYLCEVTNE